MTAAEILLECGELSVRSNAVEINMLSYLNRAIRYIAQRANLTFMANVNPVTIPASQTSVTMPLNFKVLYEEQSPISFTYGQYRLPVEVTTRSRIEACGLWPLMNGPLSNPLPGGYLPVRVVFMERDGPGGAWTLNVPPQFILTTAMTFNVHAYYYPDPLQGGEFSNAFTNQPEIVEAVIARTKALAFFAEDPTSPKGLASMQQFEAYLANALYQDTMQKLQFNLRM